MSTSQDDVPRPAEMLDIAALQLDPDVVRRLTITQKIVETLVQPAPHWNERVRPRHANIMERLAGIDPATAKHFAAREDYFQHLKIRFVNPMTPYLPENRLNYDAVTYSWHYKSWSISEALTPPDQTSDELPNDHVRSPISREMWKVVLAESASWNNFLWIDQICIKQEDRDEKKAAVGFTDRVYQNADRIFIVIEDRAITEEVVTAIMKVTALDVNKITDIEYTKLGDDCVQLICDFCLNLFSARVFSRSWCWHEYANSAQHVIFMPISSKSGPKIFRLESHVLFPLWTIFSLHRQRADEDLMASDITNSEIIFRGHRAARKLLEPYSTPSLPEAFRNVFRSRATRKADQLAIVLNSCGFNLIYTGDALDSEEECYRLLHSVALAAGDGSVLGNDGINVKNVNGTLSTWLQKPWETEAEVGYMMMLQNPADMQVQVSADGVLFMDVIILAQVKDVKLPDPQHLDTAMAFMDLDFRGVYERNPYIFEREVHALVVNDWDKLEMRQRYVSQKMFFAQTLAYLISFGDEAFLDEVIDVRLKRSKTLLSQERRTLLKAVLTWLRSFSDGPNVHSLLSSRPASITNGHLMVVAAFVEFMIYTVLCVGNLQNLGNVNTWDSYVVATLRCNALGNRPAPPVVPRAHLEALITIPAGVADAEHSLLRRVWVVEELGSPSAKEHPPAKKPLSASGLDAREQPSAGEQTSAGIADEEGSAHSQSLTDPEESTSTPISRYVLVWKTKLHHWKDLSSGEPRKIALE